MSVLSAIRPLVRSNEDLASLALTHILQTSAVARTSMNRSIAVDEAVTWTAQHILHGDDDEAGRPDLAGHRGESIEAFVEAKFDAGLTEAQPVTYLLALPENGHLAFLVPESRAGYVTRELHRRLGQADASVVETSSHHWQVVLQGATRRLSVQSWESVVQQLVDATERPEARPEHQDLLQLQQLVADINQQLYRPISAAQLTAAEIPQVALQVIDLLRGLRDALQELGYVQRGKYASTIDGWSGFTLDPPASRLGWSVHQSWSAWLHFASTPLWLTLGWEDRARYPALLETWLRGEPPRAFRIADWSRPPVAVPLHLPGDADRPEVILALRDQVQEAVEDGEQLLAAGGSGAGIGPS